MPTAPGTLSRDADHRYWWTVGDKATELVGCTNALKSVGLIDIQHYTDEGLARGNWVHRRIEARLIGSPDGKVKCETCSGEGVYGVESPSDNMDVSEQTCADCHGEGWTPDPSSPDRVGYVVAAQAYLRDAGADVLNVEYMMADPARMIAGTPDVIAMIPVRNADPRFAIIDWKTGGPERWHGYQLAWYEHLARVNNMVEGLCDRIVVHLNHDATYSTRRHKDRDDWKVADAARLVEQAKWAA